MATTNPFDLLGDDVEDPSQLIVTEQLKAAAAAPAKKAAEKDQGKRAQTNKPAQLPSKPAPPAQAVRESRNEGGRGGGRGFGGERGGGRGFGGERGGRGRGFGRDFSSNDDNSFPASRAPDSQGALEGEKFSERRGFGGPRPAYRGGRRGGFSNGEGGEEGRPRRAFERHSGTGRGSEFKRDGAGRGNWGTETDEVTQVTDEVVNEAEKNLGDEKPAAEKNLGDEKPAAENDAAEGNKDNPANEAEEKEPEDKEMTLEEYEKLLEDKRKALQALKTEERKVDTKEFETMQALSCKKDNFEIFAKLGSDKDKRKEAFDKEEKAKKSVSINEFLKPAEGEGYYNQGGRGGRGRSRGTRGGGFGGFRGNSTSNVPAPSIEDPGHFPTLGAK